ncbi:MAG: hypothetical protein WC717_03540 [Candidatus Micrarchaeia archaeon]|jgi:hypothetical protein
MKGMKKAPGPLDGIKMPQPGLFAGRKSSDWEKLLVKEPPAAKLEPAPAVEIARLSEKELDAITGRKTSDRQVARAGLDFAVENEKSLNALDIAEIFRNAIKSELFLPGVSADFAAGKLCRQDSLKAVFEVFLENPSESFRSYRRAREFPPDEVAAIAERLLKLENNSNALIAARMIDVAPARKKPGLYQMAAIRLLPEINGGNRVVALGALFTLLTMQAKQIRMGICEGLGSRWKIVREDTMRWAFRGLDMDKELHSRLCRAAGLNGIRAVEIKNKILFVTYNGPLYQGLTLKNVLLYPFHMIRVYRRHRALLDLGKSLRAHKAKNEGNCEKKLDPEMEKLKPFLTMISGKKAKKGAKAAETQ